MAVSQYVQCLLAYIVLDLQLRVVFSAKSCPDITSRSRWNAETSELVSRLSVNPPNYVVVHHSALEECFSWESCKKNVYAIQILHMETNGWGDIGYNFLIGGDGNVFEGRGWGVRGAHSIGFNNRSIGICLLGNFMNKEPAEAQVRALRMIIKCGVEEQNISSNYRLIGHRQASPTLCPGDLLFRQIIEWDHFEDNLKI